VQRRDAEVARVTQKRRKAPPFAASLRSAAPTRIDALRARARDLLGDVTVEGQTMLDLLLLTLGLGLFGLLAAYALGCERV
jgi:hypothetical protein